MRIASLVTALLLGVHITIVQARPRGSRKEKVHVGRHSARTLGHDNPWCGRLGMMDTCPPTLSPTVSSAPSEMPTVSSMPSMHPSALPSAMPSVSMMPTISLEPSSSPSARPSASPSRKPSASPSESPTMSSMPSARPSLMPSSVPSRVPSLAPTMVASSAPSAGPSSLQSSTPSISSAPSLDPLAFDTIVVEGIGLASTCRPEMPDTSTSQLQVIRFNYTVITELQTNLTQANTLIASSLHTRLAQAMLDCDFEVAHSFYQRQITTEFGEFQISTSPCPENLIYDILTEACTVVDAAAFSHMFYRMTQRRRLQEETRPPLVPNITDRSVGMEYNKTISLVFDEGFLPDDTVVKRMKYYGLTNFYPESDSESYSNKAGAIAGGVIGGLAGMILVIFLLVVARKRQRSHSGEVGKDDEENLMDDLETTTAAERTKTLFVHDDDESTIALPIVAGEDESTQGPSPIFVPVLDTPDGKALRDTSASNRQYSGLNTSYEAHSSTYQTNTSDTVDL